MLPIAWLSFSGEKKGRDSWLAVYMGCLFTVGCVELYFYVVDIMSGRHAWGRYAEWHLPALAEVYR